MPRRRTVSAALAIWFYDLYRPISDSYKLKNDQQ